MYNKDDLDIEFVARKDYKVPWWVTALNSLPHFDLALEYVNSTFNFDDRKYQEVRYHCYICFFLC